MNHLFIIGAQRSGSTYLYELLDAHPQVSMVHPARPEPKFFLDARLVADGVAAYERRYFPDRKERGLYLGEKSTSYIESAEAASRIRGFYPDARILVILRDPVLRAYSNYRFSVAHGLEPMSFMDALAAEPERLKSAEFSTSVSPYAYRQRGYYIEYIEKYLEVFEAGQIKVLIFEELVNNLNEVQALYRWLAIDPDFVPSSLAKLINPAPTNVGLSRTTEAFKSLACGYEESMGRLEGFLGRALSCWREHHRQLMLA